MRSGARQILVVVITVLVVAVLLLLLPSGWPQRILSAYSATSVALALIFYMLSYMVISLRWHLLFGGGALNGKRLASLFGVSCVHNLYNQLIPARLGEFSIFLLAKRYLFVPGDVSGSSLVLARAMDFLSMGLAGVVLLLGMPQIMERESGLALLVGLLCLLPVLGVVAMLAAGTRLASIIEPNDHASGWVARGRSTLAGVARLLGRRRSVGFYAALLGLSLLLVAVRMLMFAALLATDGSGDIAITAGMVIGLCTLLAGSSPMQGILNTGTFEGGWVLGSILIGIDAETALVSAVAAHLVFICFQVVLGLGGQLWLSLRGRR